MKNLTRNVYHGRTSFIYTWKIEMYIIKINNISPIMYATILLIKHKNIILS